MRLRRRRRGDLLGALDAEVAHRGDDHRGLDPARGARVVDALREPRELLVVGEPGLGGVVGRGDELDVDRALGGARRRYSNVMSR